MAILIVGIFLTVSIALAYVVNGWALHVLWGWFIVPLGAPAITLPWAIGIGVVSFITNHQMPDKEDKPDAGKVWLNVFLRPVLAIAIGWIVLQFMPAEILGQ